MTEPTIDAVFFDAGNTLMDPIGGRWFPGHHFFDLCRRHGHDVPDDEALERACHEAYQYLIAHHRQCPDLDAERAQFTRYYEIVFEQLKRPPVDGLAAKLASSLVDAPNFEPFAETRHVLDTLRQRRMPMAVITDAWPSVRPKFDQLGFLQYFDAFVVSAEERCNKPHMGMFRPALDAIGVTLERVLFVDDSPFLIKETDKLGFQTLLADYETEHTEVERRIGSIGEVLGWLS